jgi:hypothetical protein
VSTRLPVVSARTAASRPKPFARVPRSAVSRTLLCVTGSGDDATAHAAALRVGRALVAQVARGGRPVAALLVRDDGGTDGAVAALREAGAQPVVALESARLPEAALAALDALDPEAIAIGIGAELAAHLQAALTIQVGRTGAGTSASSADLELHAEAEAVASEIGAWLAQR